MLVKKKLLGTLQTILNDPDKSCPICIEVVDRLMLCPKDNGDEVQEVRDILEDYFKSWEHFSGDPEYPVEGSFSTYLKNQWNYWDRINKYGKLRHNLLEYLINQLKEELGEK